ncbi:MAG: methyltransferase [Caulobacteraceae bacterium]
MMNLIDRRGVLVGLGAVSALVACPAFAATDQVLADVIANGPRAAADKARDSWRHPYASLVFWGLNPGMTVIEVDPGQGWWTDILAPYLARTGGHYIATAADLADPKVSDGAKKGRAAFEAKYQGDPKLYGDVRTVGFGAVSGPLAPAGTVDLVLVSRETHNWVKPAGFMQKALGDFHAALKPAGVLAIEDHRAPDGADPAKGDGYISEAYMIGEARKGGFVLGGAIGDQRQSEGHQGPSVRGLDPAADPAEFCVRPAR